MDTIFGGLLSFTVYFWDTVSSTGRTGLMRNAEEGQKGTPGHGLELATESTLVSSVCVNMGPTYEGVTSDQGAQ